MWKPALRIVCQLALTAPVLLLSPFAIVLALSSVISVTELTFEEFGVALTYILSGLALPFLLLSIVLTTRALRRKPWRLLVTMGLVSGVIGALLWMGFASGPSKPEALLLDPWSLYLFGGPIVVAGWNLWRAWQREEDPAISPP